MLTADRMDCPHVAGNFGFVTRPEAPFVLFQWVFV
jgi:hypothetical protein